MLYPVLLNLYDGGPFQEGIPVVWKLLVTKFYFNFFYSENKIREVRVKKGKLGSFLHLLLEFTV